MTAHNFEVRKALYQQIEEERGSKVINYVTGDRPEMNTHIGPDAIDLFVDHLDELWPMDKLTLVLYTTGGETATAWRLINLLRIFCEELEIVVISKALSAGTLMCLGADNIVMTKQAALGPIDPSLHNPLNPQVPGGPPNYRVPVSVEAVQGYLDIAKEALGINGSSSRTQVLTDLSAQVHPLVLGQIFRTRKQIRLLAEKLLDHQKVKSGKKEGIVSFLCSDSGSHDHTINRREARELGLVVEKPSEEFYQILKGLQSSIDETLQLRSAFSHDTELKGQAEATYNLRRAMIESAAHGCHHYVSEGKLKEIKYVRQPDHQPQTVIQSNRIFEGWRKEA